MTKVIVKVKYLKDGSNISNTLKVFVFLLPASPPPLGVFQRLLVVLFHGENEASLFLTDAGTPCANGVLSIFTTKHRAAPLGKHNNGCVKGWI